MRQGDESESQTPIEVASERRRLRTFVAWLAVIGLGTIAAALIAGLLHWASLQQGDLTAIAAAHFPAVIGLPFAALAALCLVLVLEARAGPIELEAFKVKFRGASGPIVFWILCFAAMVAAIAVLWRVDKAAQQ